MYAFVKQMDHEVFMVCQRVKRGSFGASLSVGCIDQSICSALLREICHFISFEQLLLSKHECVADSPLYQSLQKLGLGIEPSVLLCDEPSAAMLALCAYIESVSREDARISKLAYCYVWSESCDFWVNAFSILQKKHVVLLRKVQEKMYSYGDQLRVDLINVCETDRQQKLAIQVVRTTAFMFGTILHNLADQAFDVRQHAPREVLIAA